MVDVTGEDEVTGKSAARVDDAEEVAVEGAVVLDLGILPGAARLS